MHTVSIDEEGCAKAYHEDGDDDNDVKTRNF